MRLTNLVDELHRDHPWMDVVGVETVTDRIVPGDAWKNWGPHFAGSGPLGVTVHHTGAGISWVAIVRFEWNKYENVKATSANISDLGQVAVMSAGAAATNGSGLKLHQFSRGLGGRNSDQFTIEVHNPGTGAKSYPAAQMRSILAVCYTVNRLSGNQFSDVTTHQEIAPDRKSDPARASNIEGPCAGRIRSITAAGTWSADDLRAEAVRFAASMGQPSPQGDDVHPELVSRGSNRYDLFATGDDGQLYQKWWDPPKMGADKWSEWAPLGGRLVGPPTATVSGERIDIMGVGADGHIWQLVWDGTDWAPWFDLGDNP
jgi:hypothetical protein